MATIRLTSDARRAVLVEVGAQLFAGAAYDDVAMEDVARRAGVSRALLYRHFASKRDLFAAVYQDAADQLLSATQLDPGVPLAARVGAGLDAHIDYFVAHRTTVLAANRVLAGDPTIQAIITGELTSLREALLDSMSVDERSRDLTSAVLMSWLTFVHVLCVEWLVSEQFTREQLRNICVGALLGALSPSGPTPG